YLSESTSSATTVWRLRYIDRISASPTATSAAATTNTNAANACPAMLVLRPLAVSLIGVRKRQKATRLMLTALSISSTPIRIATALRLASTVYTPMQNRAAATSRYASNGTISPPPAQ